MFTCPKCHEGKLFASLLKVAPACERCGLPIGAHDAADGPTFFALIIVGFLVVSAAGVVEYHFAPPMWLHALLWLPLTFFGCIYCLRLFKAWFVAWEFRAGRLEKIDG